MTEAAEPMDEESPAQKLGRDVFGDPKFWSAFEQAQQDDKDGKLPQISFEDIARKHGFEL
jgi:hypothetical protein